IGEIRLKGREPFGSRIAGPQALRTTKVGNAGVRGDPGASEHGYAPDTGGPCGHFGRPCGLVGRRVAVHQTIFRWRPEHSNSGTVYRARPPPAPAIFTAAPASVPRGAVLRLRRIVWTHGRGVRNEFGRLRGDHSRAGRARGGARSGRDLAAH